MTSTELKTRIEAAQTRIEKKRASIERYNKAIAKRAEILAAAGFAPESTFADIRTAGNVEANYAAIEIEQLRDDIRSAEFAISDAEATIEKYKAALLKAEREEAFVVPSVLDDLAAELVRRWDSYDKERREFLRKAYEEDQHPLKKNYRRLHVHEDQLRRSSDETIHSDNVRAAHMMVKDLVIRVHDITGDLVDWSGIQSEVGAYGPVLNGFVKGDKGAATVETISAGGYNIQRLHVRTLVKKCKA